MLARLSLSRQFSCLRFGNRCWLRSDQIMPSIIGWTIWTPCGWNSLANDWARPRSANLAELKGLKPALPLVLAVAPVRMSVLASCSCMNGIAAWLTLMAVRTLLRQACSKSLASSSRNFPLISSEALCITTLGLPYCFMISLIIVWVCLGSVRSAWKSPEERATPMLW